MKILIDTKNSQGSWIVDAKTGHQYLDCFSNQILGWNHPKIICEKEKLLEISKNDFFNSESLETIEYKDFENKFKKISKGFRYNYFFSSKLEMLEKLLSEFKKVLYFKESYHEKIAKHYWKKIINPKVWHNKDGPDNFMAKNLEDISLKEIEQELKNSTNSAIIIEPIQNNGDNHFRKEFLNELLNLSNKYESILIFDESDLNIASTGRFWCYENFKTKPDILCFGSKIFGFCCNQKRNYTSTLRVSDIAKLSMEIDVIQEDELFDNSREVGDYFLNEIIKLESSKIKNIRGKGLVIAFDVENRDDFIKKISKKIILSPTGKKSIRLRPSLDFTKLNVDEAIEFIKNCL